ncbi:hypothetical protein Tco_0553265 [Tanacetum coccineum]
MFSSNSTGVASSSSVRRPESKDNNLKKRVLLKTKYKSTSNDVKKSQSSVSLVSNKRDTLNLIVFKSKANVLNVKTVNAVNDGSNFVCVSFGKDVFMISHDKCVACYALSVNSRVKRALFTSTVAAKSSKLLATPVVAKSRTRLNCINFQDSSKDSTEIPSKEDLDNLFGPLCEEYYATKTLKVLDNSTANTFNNKDTPSSSSIIIEEHEAPQVVSSSKEPISNEPTTLVSDDNADESVQEDVTELNGNTFINLFCTPEVEEAESSSKYQDPSNMHEFYQQHRSTDKWTKNRPIEQVISDPLKLVMTRSRLHTDVEMCMYALAVSTIEPTNIEEAMLDHSWIESMQDELNQFKRLDVWELVERPKHKQG